MTVQCFVIMPFGEKADAAGNRVDFDDVYRLLLKPAIEGVGDVAPVRCDEIEMPGAIHSMMIGKIADCRLAVVDISTLNPNVFYELGVRHALKRSGTVLVRSAGTQSPFNIEGFNCLEYNTGDHRARAEFSDRLQRFIRNSLADPDAVDSLVHEVLDDLYFERSTPEPQEERQVIARTECHRYGIAGLADRQIGIITGDLRNIDCVDVWVNSENTNMQMARFYERSVSGLIRYLGASKAFGTIREDSIALALEQALGGATRVEQAAVVPTGPGELAGSNRVKLLLHVASVEGELGVGYRPIAKIHWCVGNALREADDPKYADLNLSSILFPVMGTGTGGGSVRDMAEPQIREALRYLCATPDSSITQVWFSAFDASILGDLRGVMDSLPELSPMDDQ